MKNERDVTERSLVITNEGEPPAFRDYNERFRPFIDEVQAEAVRVGLETLVPRTEEAIRARNAKTSAGF